jgi:glycosyltransferase involved in cell wall biosynthesis
VSVLVCTHNGAATLDECLTGLGALRYPDYEVIVVDDGSTDGSAAIARAHDVELISTENRG